MYIVFYLFSIVFAFLLPSIHENYTHLYNNSTTKMLYMIWIVSLSIFLFIKCMKIYKRVQLPSKLFYCCLYSAFISMMIGAIIPYGVEIPFLSTLHVIFALLGSLLTLVVIKLLVERSQFLDIELHPVMQQYYMYFMMVLVMCTTIFGSVNVIVELILIGCILYMLYRLEKIA